jgi:hypothetical protein
LSYVGIMFSNELGFSFMVWALLDLFSSKMHFKKKVYTCIHENSRRHFTRIKWKTKTIPHSRLGTFSIRCMFNLYNPFLECKFLNWKGLKMPIQKKRKCSRKWQTTFYDKIKKNACINLYMHSLCFTLFSFLS